MSGNVDIFWSFLRLGIHHILSGYDHLMFVFGLLVVCHRWQTIFKIVISFSIAHSITLILSTMNVVVLPEKYAEPLISFSLVIVGVENLLRRGQEPPRRWMLAFAFGLVHGFGFAAGLREMGIATSGGSIFKPLLGFNLGVEIGQIIAGIVILPILLQLRKSTFFVTYVVPVLSAVVAAGGIYWTVQRLFF